MQQDNLLGFKQVLSLANACYSHVPQEETIKLILCVCVYVYVCVSEWDSEIEWQKPNEAVSIPYNILILTGL